MSYSQPMTDIIRARYSCRTYLERPIAAYAQQRLVEFAAATTTGPLGSRVRSVLVAATAQDREALRGLGTYGFIKGATGFLIGATTDGGNGLEDFGYLMEQLVLFATDLGLGTCWLGGTFNRSRFADKISLQDGETVPSVVSVGYIAQKPRALDAVIRLGAGSHARLPWQRLFFEREFGAPLSREAAGRYATPLEMVRLGPSASNRQPWRIIRDGQAWHFYLQRTRGYRMGTRLSPFPTADLQRVDMGIAMCHFALTARELGLAGRWVLDEPDLEKPDDLTDYTASWIG
jgi:nitroreductase